MDWIKDALNSLGKVPDFPTSNDSDSLTGSMVPIQTSKVWLWLIDAPNGGLFLPKGDSRGEVRLNSANSHFDVLRRYDIYETAVAEGLDLPAFKGSVARSLELLLVAEPHGDLYAFDEEFLGTMDGARAVYKLLYKVVLMKLLVSAPFLMDRYRELLRFSEQQQAFRAKAKNDSRAALLDLIDATAKDYNDRVNRFNNAATKTVDEASYELQAAKSRLEESETELKQANVELLSAQGKYQDAKDEMLRLNNSRMAASRDLQDARNAYVAAQTALQAAERKASVAKQKETTAAAEYQQLYLSRTTNDGLIASTSQYESLLSTEQARTNASIEAIQTKITNKSRDATLANSQSSTLRNDIKELRVTLPDLDNRITGLSSDIEVKVGKAKTAGDDARAKKLQVESIDATNTAKGGPIPDAESRLKETRGQIDTVRRDIGSLTTTKANKETEFDTEQDKIKNATVASINLADAQNEVLELRGAIGELRNLNYAPNMLQAGQGRFSGSNQANAGSGSGSGNGSGTGSGSAGPPKTKCKPKTQTDDAWYSEAAGVYFSFKPYSTTKTTSADTCKSSCFADSQCAIASFSDGTCSLGATSELATYTKATTTGGMAVRKKTVADAYKPSTPADAWMDEPGTFYSFTPYSTSTATNADACKEKCYADSGCALTSYKDGTCYYGSSSELAKYTSSTAPGSLASRKKTEVSAGAARLANTNTQTLTDLTVAGTRPADITAQKATDDAAASQASADKAVADKAVADKAAADKAAQEAAARYPWIDQASGIFYGFTPLLSAPKATMDDCKSTCLSNPKCVVASFKSGTCNVGDSFAAVTYKKENSAGAMTSVLKDWTGREAVVPKYDGWVLDNAQKYDFPSYRSYDLLPGETIETCMKECVNDINCAMVTLSTPETGPNTCNFGYVSAVANNKKTADKRWSSATRNPLPDRSNIIEPTGPRATPTPSNRWVNDTNTRYQFTKYNQAYFPLSTANPMDECKKACDKVSCSIIGMEQTARAGYRCDFGDQNDVREVKKSPNSTGFWGAISMDAQDRIAEQDRQEAKVLEDARRAQAISMLVTKVQQIASDIPNRDMRLSNSGLNTDDIVGDKLSAVKSSAVNTLMNLDKAASTKAGLGDEAGVNVILNAMTQLIAAMRDAEDASNAKDRNLTATRLDTLMTVNKSSANAGGLPDPTYRQWVVKDYAAERAIVVVGTDKQVYLHVQATDFASQNAQANGYVTAAFVLKDLMYGLGEDKMLYTRPAYYVPAKAWTQVANSGFTIAVAVGDDGTVYGVGTDNLMYKAAQTQPWKWQLIENTGYIVSLTQVPQGFVSVGMDGALWFRSRNLTSREGWVRVNSPAGNNKFKSVAHAEGKLVVVDTAGKIAMAAWDAGTKSTSAWTYKDMQSRAGLKTWLSVGGKFT